ncbi:hypothetical protein C9439_02985 [archaeon SCG-AAA382B04]|nr:hypothetical protein C9439_02985 [archaeon SCG-AAA382B04]
MRINALKRTITKYAKHVNFKASLNKTIDYINQRRQEVSNRTLADNIQMIKQFLNEYNVNWTEKINKPNVGRKRPKRIDKKDVNGLIDQLEDVDIDYKYFYRAKTAVVLSAVSGMRPWEIYRLQWNELNVDERIVELPAEKTKTKHERIVVFNEEAQNHLTKLMDLFEEQPFSTKTIYCLTKKMKNKPDVKLKHCRKYFSQQWDREGLPTSIKEMLLGHFGNVDLRNYDRQSAEDLKQIYDRAEFKLNHN